MSFYRDEMRIARKEHLCYTCHAVIKIGEKYHNKAGNEDGDLWDAKECDKCQPIIYEYLRWANENEYYDDDINEWWLEEKCPQCINYWPECKPDENCENPCGDEQDGKCVCGDSCDEMTHYCRCEKYEVAK